MTKIEEQWRETLWWLEGEVLQAKDHAFPLLEEIAYWEGRLQDAKNAWTTYRDHPTIRQMAWNVAKHLEHFTMDFHAFDLPSIVAEPDRVFIWGVRKTGTAFIWLDADDEETLKIRQSTLDYYCQTEKHVWFRGSLNSGLRRLSDPSSIKVKMTPNRCAANG